MDIHVYSEHPRYALYQYRHRYLNARTHELRGNTDISRHLATWRASCRSSSASAAIVAAASASATASWGESILFPPTCILPRDFDAKNRCLVAKDARHVPRPSIQLRMDKAIRRNPAIGFRELLPAIQLPKSPARVKAGSRANIDQDGNSSRPRRWRPLWAWVRHRKRPKQRASLSRNSPLMALPPLRLAWQN